jgi:hypothetical protein
MFGEGSSDNKGAQPIYGLRSGSVEESKRKWARRRKGENGHDNHPNFWGEQKEGLDAATFANLSRAN